MKRVYQIFSGTQEDLFNQVVDHIGYFKSLHVTDIWFTPFVESPSYHGYDCTDFFKIKPEIGTMEEFERMCKKLHEHEIGVMFDLVPCHVSNQHRWFKDHPEYFIWSDEKRGSQRAYGNFDQSSENAWHWDEEREKYFYAPFSQYMPALDLENEEVRKMLVFTARFWMNKGVDSFRLDAIIHSHLNMDDSVKFFEWFREQIPVYMVGEAWTDYYTICRYSSIIDSCFDFPLQGNLIWSTRNLDFLGLAGDLNRTFSNLTLFTGNHDMDRAAYVLGQDEDKIKLYLWLSLLFAQGQHCLYYLDEVGFSAAKREDVDVRPKMDWDEICKQLFTPDSILREYMRAVKLIDKYEVLADGKIVRVECQYEYQRLAVYKELEDGTRVKIKIQPSNKNLDKAYTVASFCGFDIVIAIHQAVI